MQHMLETFQEHPYGSPVKWRIAVSRRFNDAVVTTLYESQVLPVLAKHGMVLECGVASDETADVEFWTNRMRKILGCSDLHVLLNIHRSANMDFEFRLSGSCASMRGKNSVFRNSGVVDVGYLPALSCLPVQIRVVDGEGKMTFSRVRRYVQVHALPYDLLCDRLEEAIGWAKRKRTRELKEVRFLYDRPAMWFNRTFSKYEMPMPTVMEVQAEMTAIATELAAGHPIIEAQSELFSGREEAVRLLKNFLGWSPQGDDSPSALVREEDADPINRLSNQMDQFELDIRNGSVPLPRRFWDAYAFLKDERTRLWAAAKGGEPGKWFRNLNRVKAFFEAIRLRRAMRRDIPRKEQ